MSGILHGVIASAAPAPSGSQVFSIGTTSYTVPSGVYSITCTGCGGGGGGGSGDGGANNDGPGYGGGGSNIITGGPYAVTPGQVLSISIGASGSVGFGARGGAGFPTMVATAAGVGFFAAGGGGGGSWNGWGPPGQISPAYTNLLTGASVAAVEDTVNRGGAGANGANGGGRPTAGTTTNGGANGGTGGPYEMQAGTTGGVGKLTINY